MDIFIYYNMKLEVDRDIIEDQIDDFLGEKGEVTGGGSGISGGNIDIEIYDKVNESIVKELKGFLQELQLPDNTYLVVNGVRENLF